jgi:PAS domain S-box-containing protein
LNRNWSIRAHLIALVLAIVIPLVALEGYTMYSESRMSSERAEEGLLGLAELTAATVGQFLEDARTILRNLSDRPGVQALDEARCGPLLEDLNSFFPQYTNLFVTDLEAHLVCSGLAPGLEVPDPPVDSEWFQGVMATGDFALGKAHLGLLSGIWNVVMAYPVRDEDGEMVGVVGVSVDLIRFQDLLASPALPEGTVITIDDLDGVVVARSTESELWVGRQLPPSGLPTEVLEGAGGVTRTVGAEGDDRMFGFTAIPDSPWRVWAGVPTDVIFGSARDAAARRGSMALMLLALVGVLTVVLYRRIANSLVTLMTEARAAAKGGGRSLSIQGPREVQEVAWEFNRTMKARRQAEKGRRRGLERYRSVMENAVFGIYVCTHEGRFLEVNPALVAMLGYGSEEELRQVSVPELYRNPEDGERLSLLARPTGRIEGEEVEWVRKDGTPVTVRLSGSAIGLDDGAVALEVIAEDVTAQRILEEQVRQTQKMEAVGRLAGGVAHDFNNLLTVITGSAHLLLTDLDPEDPCRDGVEEVLDAATRGAVLTRQLLAFSRKQVLQPKLLDLNQVVLEMQAFLGRILGDPVELRTDLEPELWQIRADPGQLQQVIMNLVLNARDAIETSGPVEIRTRNLVLDADQPRARVDLPPGRYVSLAVRDEGMGIPVEIQGRVFEPFFTTKPKGRGTGLGLATVYGVAVQSGGQVALESKPGGGSVFTVFLPLAEGLES